jgi:hypothetical protein
MAKFTPGQSGNPKGRPVGAKGLTPNKEQLVELLDLICSDLVNNYGTLRTSEKIRILHAFNGLYQDSIIEQLTTALTDTNKVIRFDFSDGSEE